MSPYNDEYQSIQHMPGFTQATAWTCPPSVETLIIVYNEALWMGDKLDHTLMNSNYMRHHCINVQDKHCMQNPMVITCPEEDVTIPLYMSGTILCDDASSPTQQKSEDSLQIVLKYLHDWDPQSVCFLKGSHSKEEEYSLLRQFMLTQCGARSMRPILSQG